MKVSKYRIKQYLIIILAALASALSLEIFLLPSTVVAGGTLGLSAILDIVLTNQNPQLWYFSAGIWLVLLNVPFCIYTFVHFKKSFAIKTTLYVVALALALVILRLTNLSQVFQQLVDDGQSDRVILVLLGGAMHGVSLPLVLSQNASTGGTDVVGLMVQKHSQKSSRTAIRLILVINIMVVLVSSLILFAVTHDVHQAINTFIYSVAAMVIGEIVQEGIFKGFSSAVELEITTEKKAEMMQALREGLNHGVSTITVTGGYSGQEKSLVLCVIQKHQLITARRIINQVDPQAFAYVENVKEVIGKGFANKEIEIEN
ncbi:MAG: YitT family protein [Clostridia bacterium]|nr:YitT family protein [Clostridia bacterium]